MLILDGAMGEGGGQILRSSLSLSILTGRPFRIERIRANRSKPGLARQHLTAVEAAAAICGGRVEGAELRSTALTFHPGEVRPGEYRFAIGTAGSATLVMQTVLPPLLAASGPSRVVLEGGTHNEHAPPYDFVARSFLPALARMGAEVTLTMERPGFYPAGGGRLVLNVVPPAGGLRPLDLTQRGEVRRLRARAYLAHLPMDIGRRELARVAERLGPEVEGTVEHTRDSVSAGNTLFIEAESDAPTAVFVGFGRRGVPAEAVADEAAGAAERWLESEAAVEEHLADQLVLPLAMAGGGRFTTVRPSSHLTTNLEVAQRFLPTRFTLTDLGEGTWRVEASR